MLEYEVRVLYNYMYGYEYSLQSSTVESLPSVFCVLAEVRGHVRHDRDLQRAGARPALEGAAAQRRPAGARERLQGLLLRGRPEVRVGTSSGAQAADDHFEQCTLCSLDGSCGVGACRWRATRSSRGAWRRARATARWPPRT